MDNEEQKKLVMPVEESLQIPEGIHKGEIVDVELRENEYKGEIIRYVDFRITCDGMEKKTGEAVTLKYGCPAKITPNTKLGKTLMDLGLDVLGSTDVNVRTVIGANVQYQTTNRKVEGKGTFADVLDGTLKLE